MSEVIGRNIRSRRDEQSWTQAQLAIAADVSERTIQRAEEGHKLSAENLQSIAAALDTTVQDLRADPEAAAKEASVRAAEARYAMVPMHKAERGSDLLRVMADGVIFDTRALTTEEQEDAAARLNQELRDWVDVISELTPIEEREYAKTLTNLIEELKALGLVVAVGQQTDRLPPATAEGRSVMFSVGMVVVGPEADFKPFAVWDRTAPLRF